MKTVDKVIKSFKHELQDIYPPAEIKSITEIIFEHYLKFSKVDLFTKSDKVLTDSELHEIINVLLRLKNNEPLQYILGETFFYDLKFKVNSGVLIPRQETEELVDWIINENKNIDNLRVLDIGTGSGCIAISLAANLNMANLFAYDVSKEALEIAVSNARINKQEVHFMEKDILKSVHLIEDHQFDIIVSNPPYVLEKEKELMARNVLGFEPELALFVEDEDPLLFYKAILGYSKFNLKDGGKLYFEINEAYGATVAGLLIENCFQNVELRKDLNGKHRMIRASK